MPPHLRVLHVSKDPQHGRNQEEYKDAVDSVNVMAVLRQLLPEITLFENLTFGPSDGERLSRPTPLFGLLTASL